MKCKNCGDGKIQGTVIPKIDAQEFIGLSDVTIVNSASTFTCSECGKEIGKAVPDLRGLGASVAVALATMPFRLTSEEVRFIRRTMQFKAKDLAAQLEVTPETMSRWENGARMTACHEKLLRILAGLRLHMAASVPFSVEKIARMRIEELGDANRPTIFCERILVAERTSPDVVEKSEQWSPALQEQREAA